MPSGAGFASAARLPGLSAGVPPRQPAPAPTSGVRPLGETVGVAAMLVRRGEASLVSYGLGSCVCVTLQDMGARIVGMLHYLLPEGGADPQRSSANPASFGDTGIDQLIAQYRSAGGDPARTRCIIVGGAAVPGAPNQFNIGKRNVLVARKQLWKHGIAIAGEDSGGALSRNVRLNTRESGVIVWSAQMGERKL